MLTRLLLLAVTSVGLLVAPAAESNAERTRKLIAILQSNAPFYDKARACQQLGEFGTKEAIPVLATLLGDQHLCAYARSGLEGIPDPGAAKALRQAAARLRGNRLAGVVESLGVLRDTKAVDLLHRLADQTASGVSPQAILALGRIANEAAIRILRDNLAKESVGARTNAAAACLMAAQQLLAGGHADKAAALCDLVRHANVPMIYRAAAIRGAIVARKVEGVPLLVEQLRSQEPVLRNAALTAVREIPCDELARALNTEINQSPADLQKQLLIALVDCHNTQSIELLKAKTVDPVPEVRKTALAALGRIGGASEVNVLVSAVAANRSAEESTIALGALGRMQGVAVDEQLIQALASSSDVELRCKLIRLLASRSATNAIPELFRQAADPEAKVSVAALGALPSIAGPGELPALMALTKDTKNTAAREAAESAVAGTCIRTASTLPGTEAVLAELKQTNDPSLKNSWVNILVSLGEPKALPAVLAAVNDPNAAAADNALEQLARWPDPAPIETLLAIVQKDADPSRRQRALSSAIRLAAVAADERQRPVETLVGWFQQANDAAQTIEQRRLIVSGLGRLADRESLRLLIPYLDDPNLKQDAAVAIVQIAPVLQKDNPPALKGALDKIVATAQSKELRDKASEIAKAIPNQGSTTK